MRPATMVRARLLDNERPPFGERRAANTSKRYPVVQPKKDPSASAASALWLEFKLH
jgi:hypothetical protein